MSYEEAFLNHEDTDTKIHRELIPVIRTRRPEDQKTRRPEDQKTRRPEDQKTRRPTCL